MSCTFTFPSLLADTEYMGSDETSVLILTIANDALTPSSFSIVSATLAAVAGSEDGVLSSPAQIT